MKLMQRVKIAYSFLQSVSDQFHVMILGKCHFLSGGGPLEIFQVL